ncbi:MAG: hypothetical protein WKG07_08305 [Hymenobacter sp.]
MANQLAIHVISHIGGAGFMAGAGVGATWAWAARPLSARASASGAASK